VLDGHDRARPAGTFSRAQLGELVGGEQCEGFVAGACHLLAQSGLSLGVVEQRCDLERMEDDVPSARRWPAWMRSA
jgi:hypothetical protein